ncbi:MAG TPA: hypothetical protein VGD73_23665 [Pseudonocardia sp.]|jgi:hypothetical protein|uniref:hypothetical protein n=1 Tax=Pseudonocardia sp. TaxID=60912 RepID=UPI002EDA93EB
MTVSFGFRRSHRSRAARRCRVLAGAVLAGLVVAGCAAPGGGASAHNDVDRCAAVLPLASEVVHGRGTLTLVRPINKADVDAITREAGVASPPTPPLTKQPQASPSPANPSIPRACLIVYRGDYPAGTIPSALPPGVSGQYALIVAWVRRPALYRVLITSSLPASAKRSWWHF